LEIYTYEAFGLTIRTNFELFSIPETNDLSFCELTITKTGRWLSMPENLDDYPIQSKTPEGILYHVKDIATFLLSEDNQISICQYTDQDQLVECILMKGVMSAYFTSKGFSVFNGSAVLIENKALLFMGAPGIGFSAITAGLNKLGYTVLSDEIIILKRNGNSFSLIPSLTYSKLWEDMTKQFGLKLKKKGKVRQELPRFYIDLIPSQVKKIYPILSNVILEINATGKLNLECTRLNTFELIEKLGKHLNKETGDFSNNRLVKFNTLTALATNFRNYKITRPKAVCDVEELVDFIISNMYE
jgi:hypothetical protein